MAHLLEGKVVLGFLCQVLSFHLLGGLEKPYCIMRGGKT